MPVCFFTRRIRVTLLIPVCFFKLEIVIFRLKSCLEKHQNPRRQRELRLFFQLQNCQSRNTELREKILEETFRGNRIPMKMAEKDARFYLHPAEKKER